MRRAIRLIRFIGLIGLISPILAFAYTSPGRPTGFINDFAGVLSAEDKTQLESQAIAIKQQTGVEIAVAIVPTIGDDTIENYAVELFQEWGIGEKGKDNGALLLVAINDRQMRIEVGYGLEGQLTDLQSKQIIDDILTPAFREGDYTGGLRSALSAIGQAISTGELPAPTQSHPGLGALFQTFPFVIIGLIIFVQGAVAAMASSKSWWAGGVFGGIGALLVSIFLGFLYVGLIGFIVLIPLGLLFDWYLSRKYSAAIAAGQIPWWARRSRGRGIWFGGGRGPGGGGGFGGFGGGSSGGGGASGRW